eukprot:g3015.t1
MRRIVRAQTALYFALSLSFVASGTHGAQVLVGLKQARGSGQDLLRAFRRVSDPAHARYGQHLSREQVADMVAPDTVAVQRAMAWLASLGAADVELMACRDVVSARLAGATRAPAVPPALAPWVDFAILVHDAAPDAAADNATHAAGRGAARARAGRAGLRARDEGMDLAAQKAAYGVPPAQRATHKDNVQMVWGTGTFGYQEDDLELFYETYCPHCDKGKVAFDRASVWKGQTGKNYVEGMLDVSYISGMAGGGVRTLVANTNASTATEGGEAFGAALLAFLVTLNSRAGPGRGEDLPLVLSLSLGSLAYSSCDRLCKGVAGRNDGHSYGECWSYLQTQFQVCMFSSQAQENRIDAELQKLGLRGVTVLAAAGDGGSHFAFGPFQTGSLAAALNAVACEQDSMPVYPACSPFVLSVGGTQWQSESYGPDCSPTQPCGWTGGGGGFSWSAPAPTHQRAATAAYLARAGAGAAKRVMPAPSTYNASGRGYPDLAALAAFGIPVCDYGGCSGSGGTSAAAPTVAGMLTLVNDERLVRGLPPLGFVAPALYKLLPGGAAGGGGGGGGEGATAAYGECFVDVGAQYKPESLWDCDAWSTCTGCDNGKGFAATAGWDAQTGLGQPRFAGLLKLLTAGTPTPPPAPTPAPKPPAPTPKPPAPTPGPRPPAPTP